MINKTIRIFLHSTSTTIELSRNPNLTFFAHFITTAMAETKETSELYKLFKKGEKNEGLYTIETTVDTGNLFEIVRVNIVNIT